MNKRVIIAGTRGIPNRYGGFEQFAEQLSVALVRSGCDVYVYNPHHHTYREKEFEGVKIIRVWDPKFLGYFSQFIYDKLCIIDARRSNFDVIIQLGYTTSSVWGCLLPRKAKVICNMDGLEWNRAKYSFPARRFLRIAEHLAIKRSDEIVADAMPIKDYLDNKYRIKSRHIAYPAKVFTDPDSTIPEKFGLTNKGYHLLIARFQPDNNLEMVIKGFIRSASKEPLVIVGNSQNRYGNFLKRSYSDKRVIFLDSIFDQFILDNLRYYSKLYFHGHSAGGTNPSLLEAMATSCTICAHDNIFNRSVLGGDAWFFSGSEGITALMNNPEGSEAEPGWIENNLDKIRRDYSLENIINGYMDLL